MNAYLTVLTALAVALLGGCGSTPSGPAKPKLVALTGEDAEESGQVRVKVNDNTSTRYKLQSITGSWNAANLRLHSTSNALTADRTVTLGNSAFVANSGACGTSATACQAQASSIFTKLRPGQYLFQISLDDTSSTPARSVAVQSIAVTVSGGATTNLVVTLQTTATGTNTITAASTGTETYAGGTPSSGLLRNSTVHPVANFALVAGDTVSLASPLQASDLKANGQTTTPNVNPTGPVNGAASFASGQVSRVIASLRGGAAATVSTNVPQAGEALVGVWYDSGNEARSNTAWSSFYGGAQDTAGIVPNVTLGGVTPVVGLTTANSFTVPASLTGATYNTTEAGTAADINAVLIFRFYDNTFEHRYIGSQTKTVVLDSAAAIQATAN